MDSEIKVAIVTGGTTGIGKATSELLAKKGCKVYVLDIIPFESKENITFFQTDLRIPDQILANVQSVYEKEGKIDYLFAHAGKHLFASIEETSREQFDDLIDLNIKGIWYAIKATIPHMKERKKGSIVITGSDQTFIGKGKSSAYGLTKGAVSQLTKGLVADYTEYGIRINCVCPGTIDTPMLMPTAKRYSEASGIPIEKIFDDWSNGQPIKRLGKPEEIASMVVFLLSDESGFTTGSIIAVDGGYTSQ
jgi:NAD(P)-dependent dehydrogenase (short-subunit alcohol dehydrogenase family)